MQRFGRWAITSVLLTSAINAFAAVDPHFYAQFLVEVGSDSNVAQVNDSLAPVDTTTTVDSWVEVEMGWRWRRDSGRTQDLSLGASRWQRSHSEDAFEFDTREFSLRAEADLVPGDKRVTVGYQLDAWDSSLGGHSSADSIKHTVALQATLGSTSCRPNNLFLFYKYADVDERFLEGSALSREGLRRSAGVEFNWYFESKVPFDSCDRLGMFHRYWPLGIPSVAIGYRSDDIDAVSEYAARWDRLYVDGQIPLWGVVWSLDVSASAEHVKSDNVSIYSSVRRDDTPWQAQVALGYHRRNWDLRLGYLREDNSGSNVAEYAYTRNYTFVSWNYQPATGLRNRDSDRNYRIQIPSGGSSASRRGGQSGSSDPVGPGGV